MSGQAKRHKRLDTRSAQGLSSSFQAPKCSAVSATLLGTLLTVDGVACSSPCTFQWTSGSQHTIAAPASQSFGAGTQLLFSNWSDSGSLSHTVYASTGAVYSANYATQYYLSTSTYP